MKEWQRTIILLILLALGIGFLIWSNHQADVNILHTS